MSNQTGSQGSTPLNQFQNMSLDQIRKIIAKEEKALKKEYSELKERRKLVKRFKRLQKAREEVRQGINIKKTYKKKKKQKKTFQEYFDECIKDKKIPEDTPAYLRKALKKASMEYDKDKKIKIFFLTSSKRTKTLK